MDIRILFTQFSGLAVAKDLLYPEDHISVLTFMHLCFHGVCTFITMTLNLKVVHDFLFCLHCIWLHCVVSLSGSDNHQEKTRLVMVELQHLVTATVIVIILAATTPTVLVLMELHRIMRQHLM